jgi:hypothetical protein
VRGARWVETEALGEDGGWQPLGEGEQRGVAAWAAADPVALEASAEPVGGDVRASLEAGQQPALGAGSAARRSKRSACATEPSGSGSATAPRASVTVTSPSRVTAMSVVFSAAVRLSGWA